MKYILNSCLELILTKKVDLKMENHPFPLTATVIASIQAQVGSIIAFLFAIALSMIPTGIASYIVNERESKVKHQQLISGASMISYWLSNYLVDFVKSLIPIVFAIAMVFVFSVDLPFIWVHFLIFTIAIHPFTYATTFVFKKDTVAQMITMMMNIFLAGFLPIVILLLQAFKNVRDVGNALRWVPMFSPTYNVVNAIMQINTRKIYALVDGLDKPQHPLSWDIAGGNAVLMIASIFFWWIVIICFEKRVFSKICFCRRGKLGSASRKTENVKVDNDVQAEERRCDSIDPKNCSVLVNQLRKVYKVNGEPLIAVRDASFGLEYGECFALLGTSGAGKTTCFKTLTGDITPTAGKVYIDGLDLSSADQFSKARKLIGYCPQDNAIFEGMTVKEHLVFYSRIKGIIAHKRAGIIEKIMEELDLKQFESIR